MAIDLNDESGMVNAICGSKEYDYAPHMMKACRCVPHWLLPASTDSVTTCSEWLKPPYRKTVLYSYEGAPLEPRFIVDHKQVQRRYGPLATCHIFCLRMCVPTDCKCALSVDSRKCQTNAGPAQVLAVLLCLFTCAFSPFFLSQKYFRH